MKNLLIITQKVDATDQLLGFFIGWLQEFAKHFERVTVLCLELGTFNLPENVRVSSMGKDQGLSKCSQLWNFYTFCWGHRKEYDAVLVHMNPIWVVLGAPLWRFLGRRVTLWYTHKAVTLKLRLAEIFTSTIVTASKESFRLASRKVVVTNHGIDTDRFQPDDAKSIDDGRIRILSVGRIAPVKYYEVLVDAARILKSEHVAFSITIVGEPALASDREYAARIQEKIASYGLDEQFRFVGKVVNRDLPSYYQSHQIFVHMSQTGSLDKTMLEAMACGMTVVSSNDAAKSILPKEWTFHSHDARELAAKIKQPDAPGFNARQYVVEHHNLKKLIATLSALV